MASLRRNAIGLLALFVALGGTSYAVTALPKNSVGAAQIKPNAVGASEVKRNAVGASEIRTGAVGASEVRDGSLQASDLAANVLPKTAAPTGAAGGALSGTYPDPGLADGAVTTSKIGDGAVTAAKLAKLPSVRLTSSTATTQSIPSGATTNTGVLFNTTEYNNGFTVGTAAGGGTTLIVPVSGVYAVSAQVLWADPAVVGTTQDNGTGFRSLFLSGPQPGGVRNGSTVMAVGGGAAPTQTRQVLSTTEYFNAGDELVLTVTQNSGAAVNLRGSQNQLHLSAALITP